MHILPSAHALNRIAPLGLWLVLLVCSRLTANGQIHLGIDAAPAVQTITLREATITRGYKATLLPQAALRLRHDLGKDLGLGLRLAVGWLPKGAIVWFAADSINGFPAGETKLQAQYAAARLGAEYKIGISEGFSALGSMDFVYGRLARTHRKLLGDAAEGDFDDFFSKKFFGLDFGLAVEYRFPNGIGLRFAPTLEVQLNKAYRSSFFWPEFRGFAPRIEFFIPISKK